MPQKSAIFHFKPDTVDKPIVTQLVRDHNLTVNILHAKINPEEEGSMFVTLHGSNSEIKSGIKYLEGLGVKVILPNKNVVLLEERCTHCGVCVGQCLPKALSVDPGTYEVVFDSERCIACELCISACPFGAIESVTEHLAAKGVR
jgi:ferredoxin